MFKFIQRFQSFWHNLKLLQHLDADAFKGCVDVMEKVYPGYQALISKLIDEHQISIVKKVFAFINENGGTQKLADYYNNADEAEKQSMLDTFNNAFKKGDAFEDKVLLLTDLSNLQMFRTLKHLLGDVKDNVVVGSIQSGQRTIDDWKAVVRHEQDRGNNFKLGILDQIEAQTSKVPEISDKPKEVGTTNITLFPDEILDQLYEYNGKVFITIPSLDEFKKIIMRGNHSYALAAYLGRTTLLYLIIYRLYQLPSEHKRDEWLDDILEECRFNKDTVSRKYTSALDSTNSETRKLAKEINAIFDDYLTKR